jgi:hypothetical protein
MSLVSFRVLIQAKYMINLVNYRNEPLNPPLNNINASDTRNGILLTYYSIVTPIIRGL